MKTPLRIRNFGKKVPVKLESFTMRGARVVLTLLREICLYITDFFKISFCVTGNCFLLFYWSSVKEI